MKLHLPKGLFVAVMAACGLTQTAFGADDAWDKDGTSSYYIVKSTTTDAINAYEAVERSIYQIKASGTEQKTVETLTLRGDSSTVFMWNWQPEPGGTNLNLLVKELQFGQDGTGAGSISVNANQVVTINKVAATSSITSLTNAGTLSLGAATVGTVTNTGTLNIHGTMTGTGTASSISGTVNVVVNDSNICSYDGVTYSYADESTPSGKSGFIIGNQNLTAFKNISYTGATVTVNSQAATLQNGVFTYDAGDDKLFFINDAWAYNASQSAGATSYHVTSNGTMTFDVQAEGSTTLSEVLAGAGSVKKSGSGTLTLSGTNTYSGGTTISGGELVVNNGSALGTGMVTVQNGATLNVNGKAGAMAAIEGVTLESGSTLKNSSAPIYAATDQLSTLILDGDATIDASFRFGLVSMTGTAHNNTNLQLNGNTLTIKGSNSSNAYGVIFAQTQVTGEGNTGTIQVTEGGKILFGHDGRGDTSNLSGATISLAQGTTLDIEDSSAHVKIGGLTGNGTVTNAGKLEINGSGSYVFSGVIKDFTKDNGTVVRKGSLIKSGTGTLTLSGTNTYSGGTIIEGGNLVMGNKNNKFLGTGPVTLAGGNLIWWGNGGTINTVSVTKNSDFTIHDQDDAETKSITIGSVSIAGGTTLTVNQNTTEGYFLGNNKAYSDSWKHNLNIGVLTGAGKLDIDGPAGSGSNKVGKSSSITVNSLKNSDGSFSGDIAITSNETSGGNVYNATINTGADGASFKSLTAAGFGEAGETSTFTFNVQGATTVENINVTSGKAIIDIAKEGTLNAFSKGGDGSITMKGSGIYNLGSSTTLNATLDSTWTGTVKMTGATLADDKNLSEYVNANSRIELTNTTLSGQSTSETAAVRLDGKNGGTLNFKGTLTGSGNLVMQGSGYSVIFDDVESEWNGRFIADTTNGNLLYNGGDESATVIKNDILTGGGSTVTENNLNVEFNNTKGMTVKGDINEETWSNSTINLTVRNKKDTEASGSVDFEGTVGNHGKVNLTVGEGASAKFTNANVKLTDVTMDKGASLAITAAKTLTFQNLTLADGTTINPKEAATLVDAAEATTNVSITVSKKASFGEGATINADLTLANGATVEMADALTLGGTLTLSTGLTLGGELYTAITSMTEKSEAIVLFTGVTELLGVDALTRSGEINFSTYFTNVTSETGTYELYYNEGKVSVAFAATPVVDPDGGETDIPEPTTGALSLIGLAALAMRRRRK